jgi:hypothetical protein
MKCREQEKKKTMHLLEYLKESIIYWNLKEEDLVCTARKIRFGRVCGYVAKQTAH